MENRKEGKPINLCHSLYRQLNTSCDPLSDVIIIIWIWQPWEILLCLAENYSSLCHNWVVY